jgi:hypothetical protein
MSLNCMSTDPNIRDLNHYLATAPAFNRRFRFSDEGYPTESRPLHIV